MAQLQFQVYLKDKPIAVTVHGTGAQYAMGQLEIRNGDKVVAQFNGQEVQGWRSSEKEATGTASIG